MIIHCSKKLAAKLPDVSSVPLEETSSLGSWNGHLFTLARRQCVMVCHDATRYVLFLPGMRKEDLAEFGGKWFRPLFLGTLAALGCSTVQLGKVESALGPIRFDAATDRSVQSSLRVARRDLAAWLVRMDNVVNLDPLAVSCQLNERPGTVYGRWVWPAKAMLEAVANLETEVHR